MFFGLGPKLFEMLRRVKFDVSEVSTAELLSRDYKSIDLSSTATAQVGISSVTCSLDDVLARPDVKSAVADFLQSKGLSCLVLMTIYFQEGSDKANRQVSELPAKLSMLSVLTFLASFAGG